MGERALLKSLFKESGDHYLPVSKDHHFYQFALAKIWKISDTGDLQIRFLKQSWPIQSINSPHDMFSSQFACWSCDISMAINTTNPWIRVINILATRKPQASTNLHCVTCADGYEDGRKPHFKKRDGFARRKVLPTNCPQGQLQIPMVGAAWFTASTGQGQACPQLHFPSFQGPLLKLQPLFISVMLLAVKNRVFRVRENFCQKARKKTLKSLSECTYLPLKAIDQIFLLLLCFSCCSLTRFCHCTQRKYIYFHLATTVFSEKGSFKMVQNDKIEAGE